MDPIDQIVLHLSIENEEIVNIKFFEDINFSNRQTVQELKDFIMNKFDINVESIQKNYNELQNGPLNNLGIVNDDNIFVFQKLQCVYVYDVLVRGERKEHLFSNMERVSGLQGRIAASLNAAANSLVLFHNNDRLDDTNTIIQDVNYLEDNSLIKDCKLGNNPTITFCEIKNLSDLVELGDNISVGQFSQVYTARIVGNDQLVLIKRYTATEQSYKPILRELISLAKLEEHLRIINLVGFFKDEIYFYIAMEHMEKGSLHSYVRTHGPVNEELIAKWSEQILEGLAHLHKNRIIHCDLKSSNILLDNKLDIKISGFSLSKFLAGTNSSLLSEGFLQSKPGTCNFMAPEVLIDQTISSKSDVWSFGAVLVELVTGRQPFHGMESINIILMIAEKQTISFDPREGMSENLKDFIGKCLMGNPRERSRVNALLEHPFLNPI